MPRGPLPVGIAMAGRPTNVHENLHDSLLDDLCRDSSPFTLLLGGIGCGKSTHMRQMAKSLCARHTAGDHTLVPLYISLDGYAGYSQLTLDRYITMELQRSYQRIQWSWYTLSKLRIQGQIVLFLDGLDEIKSLTTEDQFKRQVNHILDVIGGECRCVISCRSSAVESETGALSWFQRQIVERIPPRKINVLTVDPFTDAQIDEYLQLSHHEQLLASEVVQKHKPLWRRPILLKVAAECLGNPAYIGGLDSEEAALDFAVNRLLDYRPELLTLAGNAMSHSQWRELIENCALEMLLAKRRSFLPTELEAILRKDRVMTIDVASLDSIVMDTRLRTVFDLGRSGIEFGHIVFRDFLAAHALARKMLVVDERHDRIVGALLDADFLRFLRYAVKKLRPETELLQRLHQPRTAPPGPRTLQWIWIPPGLGLVGCHGENYNVRAKVSNWRRGFWISRTPISVGMFKECAAVSGEYGGIKVEDIEDFHDRSPLVNVSHSGATEIAKRMFIGRLPREDEWERAIGWIDGSYSGQGTESNASRTTPPYIGRNANHPWGLQDAPGSIWQWTDTQDRNSRQFVCKGAWWGATSAEKQDPWLRLIPTYAKHIRTGFRVVVDPSPHE